MKYNHLFQIVERTKSQRKYRCEDIMAQLDFYPHMLRVALYRIDDTLFPTFSICPGTSEMPSTGRSRLSSEGLATYPVEQSDTDFHLDDVYIHLDLKNFRLHYYKNNKLFFEDREGLAYNLEGELGKGSFHYLSREQDEHIYGLGDKTGNVNKNHRRFRLETFDAMGFNADYSDPLYKQIPFYICKSSIGSYGIYYDTYSNGEIDFGLEHNNYYQPYKYFHCEEEALVYYVIFGSVDEIVQRFSYLTGKSFLPPMWSFKYCGSTMNYTDSDNPQKELRNFKDKCKEYDIDCGGFYLSSGYTQIGEKRYVFHWNKEKFPDPKSFAEEFRKDGIEFLPNIKPAFLTDHPLYEEIASHGWFLHYKEGTPALFPFWGGMASYLDFTNREAFAFWTACVKEKLVDQGYCSIWNDNNEYDIHDEDILADGFGHPLPAKRIRPLFSLLMTMASNEAVDPQKRHMAVSRSGVAGLQRIAETWTGDNYTSFAQFRGNHKMAMTSALTGFPFIGQDIGGFAGPKPEKELFLRWIQYGLFTPRFCLHSWNPDGSSTMPWLYPELKETVMKLFALRKKLLPYFYSEAMRAVENYHPMIYPVFLKYEDYDVEADCFFCGESILSAPVFDEGKETVEVLLPKGRWYYIDKVVEGKQVIQNKPTDMPVYFIKEGSVIPMMENGHLIFHIYPFQEGEFTYRYYFEEDSLANPFVDIRVSTSHEVTTVIGLEDQEYRIH